MRCILIQIGNLAVASFAFAHFATAEGRWVHNLDGLGISTPNVVGGSWIEDEVAFATFSCSPSSPLMWVSLGFLADVDVEIGRDQLFFEIDGVRFYPPMFLDVETTGFLQAYNVPGSEAFPTFGQDELIERIHDGGHLLVVAAPYTDFSNPRVVMRIESPSQNQTFAKFIGTCGSEAVLAATTEEFAALPGQDEPGEGDREGSLLEVVGDWTLTVREDEVNGRVAISTSDRNLARIEMRCDDDQRPVLAVDLVDSFAPAELLSTLAVDGSEYSTAWSVRGEAQVSLLGLPAIEALRRGRRLTLPLADGSLLSIGLSGSGAAMDYALATCEQNATLQNGLRGDVDTVLQALVRAEVQDICATTGQTAEILPGAFQPQADGRVVFDYAAVECTGFGSLGYGAGFCGAQYCDHLIYEKTASGWVVVDGYLE